MSLNSPVRKGAAPLRKAVRLTTVGTGYRVVRMTLSADIVDTFLMLDRGACDDNARTAGPVPVLVIPDGGPWVTVEALRDMFSGPKAPTSIQLATGSRLLRPHRTNPEASGTFTASCTYLRVEPGTTATPLDYEWAGHVLRMKLPDDIRTPVGAPPAPARGRKVPKDRVRVHCYGDDLHLLRLGFSPDIVTYLRDLDTKLIADGTYVPRGVSGDAVARLEDKDTIFLRMIGPDRFEVRTLGTLYTDPNYKSLAGACYRRTLYRPARSQSSYVNIAANVLGIEPGIATKDMTHMRTSQGLTITIEPGDMKI